MSEKGRPGEKGEPGKDGGGAGGKGGKGGDAVSFGKRIAAQPRYPWLIVERLAYLLVFANFTLRLLGIGGTG